MTPPFSTVLRFMEMLNQFRAVERVVHVPHSERMENDVEHSYQLAMLAWYIVDSCKLSLDMNKVIRYGLIHDLVEVYAGDTYLYATDPNVHESKEEREREAQDKLKETFPEFQELHDMITEYEKREDDESRFVYALDKIHPMMNVYLGEGKTWKEMNITLEMLIEKKKDKVVLSPQVKKYFDEFVEILEKNREILFPA